METQYLNLLQDVLDNGESRGDRTGVGTLSVFGRQIRCNLQDGFPAITTKKLAWRAVAGELLWFIEGSGDERRLAEITHGSREGPATIWTPNAQAPYWKNKARYEGDLGRVYGTQWRGWRHTTLKSYDDFLTHPAGGTTYFGAKVLVEETDQLRNIVNTLRTNPNDRRMVLTAFNVGEMDKMALPPCHMFSQFYASTTKNTLSCQVYIRSNDLFLGLPFNIASYALLTHMLAQVTGFKAGELVISIGDAHIYLNHLNQVREQLSRTPLPLPQLRLSESVTDIDAFGMQDIELVNYESYGPIRAPMAV
jgi:thymidylate synthase